MSYWLASALSVDNSNELHLQLEVDKYLCMSTSNIYEVDKYVMLYSGGYIGATLKNWHENFVAN